MQNMEETLRTILDRNKRVEVEKAWETSATRRIFIAALTYLTAAMMLWMLQQPMFLLLALIPAIAYLLSTLSLTWIKRVWMKTYDLKR